MGLLDFMNPPENPQGMDPNYGVSNQQMYDARMDSMGSLGALLLAAGQRMMPNERAQLLAKVGNIPGQMNQQLDTMSQAQLRSAQARAAQQQLLMQQNIMKQLGVDMGGGQPASAPAPSAGATIGATAAPASTSANGTPPALTPAQSTLSGGIPAVGSGIPTVPQVSGAQTMDSTGRALTMLGAVAHPEEAGRTLNEANQWAKTPTSITATSPNGQVQTIPTTNGQLAGMQQALTQQGWTLGERKPTGFQSELDKIDAKKMEEWSATRDQAPVAKARLADMAEAANHFTPGRGTSAYMEMAGYLNNAFGTDAFADPEKMGSYDAFVKNSLQLVGAQVKDQEGARAAASLWTMLQKAQPTAETSPVGMQRMMRFMNAVIDYNTAKANAADQWAGTYGSLRANGKTFDKEFTSNVDFSKFIGKYMTPDELKALPPSLRKQYGGE